MACPPWALPRHGGCTEGYVASWKGFKEESDLLSHFCTIELILGAGGVGRKGERDGPGSEDISALLQVGQGRVRRGM